MAAADQKRWLEALNTIVRKTQADPSILDRLRSLRKTQDLNEQGWSEARAQVQETFRKRRHANGVIRAAGGQVDDAMVDAEEKAALRRYDTKLHAAFEQMLAAQEKTLAEMGLPVLETADGKRKMGQLLDQLLGS